MSRLDESGNVHPRTPHGHARASWAYTVDLNAAVISELEFTTPAVTSGTQQTPAVTDKYMFADYRRVQGILTPFKTTRFVDGMKVEEMQFTSIRYNAAIKDSDFKP